jgi:hypothetical protein
MNAMAPTVSHSTPAATCRAQATTLVGLIQQSASSTGPADQQLSELLSDEESTLAEVFADCAQGSPSKTALAELTTIHTEVDGRLHSDGVRS